MCYHLQATRDMMLFAVLRRINSGVCIPRLLGNLCCW